jgi:hypothetical protein
VDDARFSSGKAFGSGGLGLLIPKPQNFGLFCSEIATSFDPPVIMPKFGAMSSAMCLPALSRPDFSSGIRGVYKRTVSCVQRCREAASLRSRLFGVFLLLSVTVPHG